MSKRNQNREKAAAGAEAPHRSVQSAIREITGTRAYRQRVAAQVLKVLAIFGGQIVKVLP
ncbi:MAG TPA: hypothetical protein P5567_11460 [Kiritimatiellia bacterium]|nr:hypothetical protein [Kiritimatiellia bacterium]HSA17477.1 hypothetical protein [Kiritimatiellia bacterium]